MSKKEKNEDITGDTEETILAAMDLLTTEVPSGKENYLKLLEIIFPLSEIHKEFILLFLETKRTIMKERRDEFFKIIDQQIATLPPRKKTFLQKRFGVLEGTPHTYEELSRETGRNREHIRLAEKITLRLTAQLPIFKALSEFLEKIWEEKLRRPHPLDES